MTRPRPAPVKPQPIADDPHAGQYQVVVSFRLRAPLKFPDHAWDAFRSSLRRWAETYGNGVDGFFDVAVREIGAQGEASEHEGTVGLP